MQRIAQMTVVLALPVLLGGAPQPPGEQASDYLERLEQAAKRTVAGCDVERSEELKRTHPMVQQVPGREASIAAIIGDIESAAEDLREVLEQRTRTRKQRREHERLRQFLDAYERFVGKASKRDAASTQQDRLRVQVGPDREPVREAIPFCYEGMIFYSVQAEPTVP